MLQDNNENPLEKAERDLLDMRSKGDRFAKCIAAEEFSLKQVNERWNKLVQQDRPERLERTTKRPRSDRKRQALDEQVDRQLRAFNDRIHRNNQLRKEIDEARQRKLNIMKDKMKMENTTDDLLDQVEKLQQTVFQLTDTKKILNDKLKSIRNEIKKDEAAFRLKKKEIIAKGDQISRKVSSGHDDTAAIHTTNTLMVQQKGVVTRLSWKLASRRIALEKQLKLMESHKEALEKIHQTTGLETIEEFIDKFNDGEAETTRLYTVIQTLGRQANECENLIRETETEIEKMKGTEASSLRDEALNKKARERLETEKERGLKWTKKNSEIAEELDQLAPFVKELFQIVGGETKLIQDLPDSSLGNDMIRCLGVIEEKVHELILHSVKDDNQQQYVKDMKRLREITKTRQQCTPRHIPSFHQEEEPQRDSKPLRIIHSKDYIKKVYKLRSVTENRY